MPAPDAAEQVCVVMAKQPRVGYAKTRLCPPLAFFEAASLYEALLKDTLALVAGLQGVALAIAVTPPAALAYFETFAPPGARLLPIAGRDIGDCLVQAFETLFSLGCRRVLALDSDSPSVPLGYISQALGALDRRDLVLGPALDGGYYLVGMGRLHRPLFEDIAWSTGQVLAQTLSRAADLGLSVSQSPPWYDVDTPSDLVRLSAELSSLPLDRMPYTRQFFASFDLRRLSDLPPPEAASA
jgi:uncharacterized protein